MQTKSGDGKEKKTASGARNRTISEVAKAPGSGQLGEHLRRSIFDTFNSNERNIHRQMHWMISARLTRSIKIKRKMISAIKIEERSEITDLKINYRIYFNLKGYLSLPNAERYREADQTRGE